MTVTSSAKQMITNLLTAADQFKILVDHTKRHERGKKNTTKQFSSLRASILVNYKDITKQQYCHYYVKRIWNCQAKAKYHM